MSERSFLHMQRTLFLIEWKQRRDRMQIIEYTEFQYDEIENLYAAVGWTAYTDDMEALRKGYAHS